MFVSLVQQEVGILQLKEGLLQHVVSLLQRVVGGLLGNCVVCLGHHLPAVDLFQVMVVVGRVEVL